MNRQAALISRTLFLSALVASSAACGYWDSYRRTKQIHAYSSLQAIVSYIEDFRARAPGQLDADAISDAISRAVPGRKDSWGNEFAFAIRSRSVGQSYIILSYGSDGKPDVPDIAEYFSRSREVVAGQWQRDIVFRDGEPVLAAGK